MADRVPDAERPTAAALAEAAEAAGYAPSVLNSQPWRWRVRADALDLFADRSRQLGVADPDGRLLTVSCGAALHHARIALAAEGLLPAVVRFPDPADPDHLARVTVAGRCAVTPAAMRIFQALRQRHTDRRPLSGVPVPAAQLDAVRHAAGAEGVNIHLLGADQVRELASATAHADAVAAADPAQRAELAYWVGGARRTGSGVPDTVIPSRPPHTGVPERDFGRPGTLEIGAGDDRYAAYAMLFGDDDEPASWLRAGEALSAGWLTATELGLSVLPFSSVVEVDGTRQVLRRMLANLGYPYLVLRLGVSDPDHAGPPHTPRLPARQVVDTSAVDRPL
jgi:nitroreductase